MEGGPRSHKLLRLREDSYKSPVEKRHIEQCSADLSGEATFPWVDGQFEEDRDKIGLEVGRVDEVPCSLCTSSC